MPSNWTPASIEEADQLRAQAQWRLAKVSRALSGDRIVEAAARLPLASSQAAAVLDLVGAAQQAAAADRDLVGVARTYLQGAVAKDKLGSRLLTTLAVTAPALEDADRRLHDANDRLAHDLQQPVLPLLRAQIYAIHDRLVSQLPSVDAAAGVAQVLPAALGSARPQTYLIFFPNPAELRPDGGVSAFAGYIRVARGDVSALTVRHEENFTPTHPCYAIPAVLAQYVRFLANCLDLEDAGWDPDFRTAAALMEQMYESKTGVALDGAIAIDPYAVGALLSVLGAITVPQFGTFTAENLFDRLDVIVNVQAAPEVMNQLAQTLMSRLLDSSVRIWPQLLGVLQQQASLRHLQVHFKSPDLESVALAGPIGGAVNQPPAADYLSVVDANLNLSKADAYITKACSVQIEVEADGSITHVVTASYVYPEAKVPSRADAILNGDGRYRDFVRFLVPAAASVTDLEYLVDGKPAAAAAAPIAKEDGLLAAGLTFVLPRGHRGEVRIAYSVPGQASRGYTLVDRKQAGIAERPTDVEVSYAGREAHFSWPLSEDARLALTW